MTKLWDFFGYITFSTFEGFAVFALSLFIYRYNFFAYFWSCLIMNVAINLQSYFIRDELSLTSLSPIFNLVLTALFFMIFIRIPVLGALAMLIVGFTGYMLIQTLIIMSGFSVAEVQLDVYMGYIVQLMTGLIGTSIGWLLYKFGFGFSFKFEKIRFRWEKTFIVSFVIIFLVLLVMMMMLRVVFTNLLILAGVLMVFLYYSFRKETVK
ncbi:hypothetical protein [Cohnella sp. AR92]|uniref:hypothetical protein n=1 Tax=Cohnella sp. AR92 TaxID=648716 RepID=UPI000F8E5150|nr:hypothetical protein [Cohnella sp. AR92]RUS44597.1 hypothetical protein ELR57_22705 [Cohnella sp. AR92]